MVFTQKGRFAGLCKKVSMPEKHFISDLITNDSLAFFRNSKLDRPDQPVMMVMSYPGPHGPEDSAPQYQDLFFNVTTHQ